VVDVTVYCCRQLPRWILVENVKGFINSVMHGLWLQVMRTRGYEFEQYLLSPESCVGLPNARKRYYFVGRLRESSLGSDSETLSNELLHMKSSPMSSLATIATDDTDPVCPQRDKNGHNDSDDDDDNNQAELDDDPQHQAEFALTLLQLGVQEVLPNQEVVMVRNVGDVLADLPRQDYNKLPHLLVPKKILESSWAGKMISLATDNSRITYCFTKGYGKIYDHSAGSCFVIGDTTIDRDNLVAGYGHCRLFHPNELLILFGFQHGFSFPGDKMSLQQQFSCIGNSVNVNVVHQVMARLFSL
jgi:site-specific DNA-cytosine methylase